MKKERRIIIKSIAIYLFLILIWREMYAQPAPSSIDESSPSRSMYFSWINHGWEGTDEVQTMANLDFFKWMHDEYGMRLDIYLLDAGTLDEGPECIGKLFGDNRYGTFDSEQFLKKFPTGLKAISDKAKSFQCNLGMWLGPDGFGTTEEEASKRTETLVSLCRDYGFTLFKFDACCSDLSADNQQHFIHALRECRKYQPELIVLNHRISLNDEAKKQTTTWLWEGKETYVDVHYPASGTGIHHRTGTLSRGLVPQLQRLTEDHGVCISSCLDFWDDDLVLQAFNRNLILAPEIYGSPWFLRDDEFPKLARIFNLHRKYNNILTEGIVLSSERYGDNAVSRGDSKTRLITLRNLNWDKREVSVKLDKTIGLDTKSTVWVRQYHPVERIIGSFNPGDEVIIEVPPFRSCLISVSDQLEPEPGLIGIDFDVIKNISNEAIEIDLLGLPGETVSFNLLATENEFSRATIDGKDASSLLAGEKYEDSFQGMELKQATHRKLGVTLPIPLPEDAEMLYEASCFAADNNALEVRSLLRSGSTKIKEVQKARDAFFDRSVFIEKGLWDKNLFDGDTSTVFKVSDAFTNKKNIVFRLDFGAPIQFDSMLLCKASVDSMPTIDVSDDLRLWQAVNFDLRSDGIGIKFSSGQKPFRYMRVHRSPDSVSEVIAYKNGQIMDLSAARASNLFESFASMGFSQSWTERFRLSEIAPQSYLAIAIPGRYSKESVYAAIKVDGQPVGAPDRAVSYPANPWEADVFSNVNGDYTYYVPLTSEMLNKSIEVFVLGDSLKIENLQVEIWITNAGQPYLKKRLILER